MIYEISTSLCIGLIIGYFIGRENTIKLTRWLYNLNTNLNLVFAEHTERDKVFDTFFKEEEKQVAKVRVFGIPK